ncbi:MAG TPA: hypothetical protein H9862_03680 [Candidatus Akkermansia intestinigallinarum]|uniref:Uncharacterized protein n=1 Tax=Candidatus Akkermansia intestinigallinarum TaxID=2838431 RepID=A0A9D2AH20_9BACT|nr:hypothetical protein [Candidatus Akkermansia intestinigallinarum]
MIHETAFLGASTILGKYWTKRRHFDYLIDKENFSSTFGHSFRFMVYLDSAVANGSYAVRKDVAADTSATNYLIRHLADIKPEFTVFVTTCDMLAPDADENTPVLESSDDPYVQNRINLYRELNLQYGRVLNVHITELGAPMDCFCPLLRAMADPPAGRKALPFAPDELHQIYFPQRILGDVERCIPLGIQSIIPAMPPLTTREIVEALNPALLKRLREPLAEDPKGSRRQSIHSFQWLDPKDGYLVTKDDQIVLLKFFAGVDAL